MAALECWLEVEPQHISEPISKVLFELQIKPLLSMTTDPATVEAESEKLGKVLDVYEARLSESKYLAGDAFTLADLNLMPYVYNLSLSSKAELMTSRPHFKKWWDEVSARPAWQKTAASIKL